MFDVLYNQSKPNQTDLFDPDMGPKQVHTALDQSGPGSNGNERVLHAPLISGIGASSSDAILCLSQDTPFDGILTLCMGYNPRILNPTNKVIVVIVNQGQDYKITSMLLAIKNEPFKVTCFCFMFFFPFIQN